MGIDDVPKLPGALSPERCAVKLASGRCLCGGVSFSVSGAPRTVAHCHCRMCQRASGAPALTWATFDRGQVSMGGATLAYHASSAGARRGFCSGCGASVSWETVDPHGVVDLCVALFDEPERFAPTYAIWTSSRIAWLELDRHLPQYPGDDPASGG